MKDKQHTKMHVLNVLNKWEYKHKKVINQFKHKKLRVEILRTGSHAMDFNPEENVYHCYWREECMGSLHVIQNQHL